MLLCYNHFIEEVTPDLCKRRHCKKKRKKKSKLVKKANKSISNPSVQQSRPATPVICDGQEVATETADMEPVVTPSSKGIVGLPKN